MLQFGHDLSAVETEVFNSFLTPSDQLQFGHDFSAVETLTSSNNRIRNKLASIRPRPFSRGNVRHYFQTCEFPCDASIRPRPFSRGNSFMEQWFPYEDGLLQFGHDLSAVETLICSPYYRNDLLASIRPRLFSRGNTVDGNDIPVYGYILQYGHDFSAVET